MAQIASLPGMAIGVLSLLLCADAVAVEKPFDPAATIRGAVEQLERNHVARLRFDDRRSRTWYREFLLRLDPQRVYFLAADIEEFSRFETRLDDEARTGSFEFPKLVRDRYRSRTKEALAIVQRVLAAEHDFTVDEAVPVRFGNVAALAADLNERWRLRLKANLLVEKIHGRSSRDVIAQLSGRHARIEGQAREMTDERLCSLYLDALAATYDSHSAYWSPTAMAALNQSVSGSSYRLGIGWRQRAGEYVIASVDSALRGENIPTNIAGYSLQAIRRLNGELLDVVELHPEDLSNLIRSPTGALKSDEHVILELWNPTTLERKSIRWPRFKNRSAKFAATG